MIGNNRKPEYRKSEYRKPEDRKPEDRTVYEDSYEIVEKVGLIRESHNGDFRLELNRVKWNNKPPVYDLRLWIRDEETRQFRPTRGVKLFFDDIMILSKILADL